MIDSNDNEIRFEAAAVPVKPRRTPEQVAQQQYAELLECLELLQESENQGASFYAYFSDSEPTHVAQHKIFRSKLGIDYEEMAREDTDTVKAIPSPLGTHVSWRVTTAIGGRIEGIEYFAGSMRDAAVDSEINRNPVEKRYSTQRCQQLAAATGLIHPVFLYTATD